MLPVGIGRRGETPPAEGVLIVLSADSRAQLQEMCGCLRAWIIENPSVDLSDLAWTLQAGRDASQRVAIQAASVSELLQNMEALLNGEENSRCRVGRAEGSCDRSEIDDTGLLTRSPKPGSEVSPSIGSGGTGKKFPTACIFRVIGSI